MPLSVADAWWSLAFVSVWLVVAALAHLTSRGTLSASTPREQGNAMVAEAHDGYHMTVLATVALASLSPLGEAIAAGTQMADLSAVPPVVVAVLTDVVVLAVYSLLALAGVLVVYLAVRPLYRRTTDKRPPLGRSLLGLSQASAMHFGPAYVVVLLTTGSRWPLVSGLLAALVLVVAVPLLQAFHNRLLVDTRKPTAEERALVTAGDLPGDVDVRVGSDDYDNHQIGVTNLLPERPLLFLGGDVFRDLSDECLRALVRVAHRQSGWTHSLKVRTPVGVWVGATTAVLVWLDIGFLLSVAALVCSYLAFGFVVAPFLDERLLTTPDESADVRAAFEEFVATHRVPLEAYIDPDAVAGAEGAGEPTVEDADRARSGDGPSEPARR